MQCVVPIFLYNLSLYSLLLLYTTGHHTRTVQSKNNKRSLNPTKCIKDMHISNRSCYSLYVSYITNVAQIRLYRSFRRTTHPELDIPSVCRPRYNYLTKPTYHQQRNQRYWTLHENTNMCTKAQDESRTWSPREDQGSGDQVTKQKKRNKKCTPQLSSLIFTLRG